MKFRFVLLLFILLSHQTFSQNQYNDDIEYKRWSFHMNNMMYRPGEANLIRGKYDIHTQVMRGYKVGFEYNFKSKHKWKLYTGLDMHFFPFVRYHFTISGLDLNTLNNEEKFDTYLNGFQRHNVISIPIGLIYRQVQSYRLSTHFKVGVNMDFLSYGQYQYGGIMEDKDDHVFRFHDINLLSTKDNVFYPGIFVAYGFDLYTKWSILHLSINAQKSILSYMNGTYEIMNLKQSPSTLGTYKLRGDYIGLDLGITLKKFKKR